MNRSSFFGKIKKGIKILISPQDFYIYPKDLHLYHSLSFSQEGEDLIVKELFHGKTQGFYVDVGAHHPQRFSNTYYFYLKGWKGINIDAMPDSMKIFELLRPNDINLEFPVSDKSETLTYYEFNESAINSFSLPLSQKRDLESKSYKIVSETRMQTQTLAKVLDTYLPFNQVIDFLSIDVEGLDYQVLISNDWEKYRPKIVLVEDLNLRFLEDVNDSKIYNFLLSKGYRLMAKTLRTLIFELII